jgi:hypothetical protein
MKGLRAAAALASLGLVVPLAHAQEVVAPDSGWEVGLRYWLSSGKTEWNHNAQSVAPAAGNPTSVLVYDKLNANSLEVQGAKRGRQGWFIAGNLGGGTIKSGSLNDSDYFAGQVKFSETTSSISDGDLAYATFDGGFDFLRPSPRTSLGVFGGFNYWNERVVASGASYIVPAGAPGIPNSVAVITNEVKWYSARFGINGRAQVGDSLHLTATVAAVPRTWMRNNDSHHLRTDLGSTPNITMDGTGRGVQLEAEARYALFKSTEIGLGVRYWKLRATGDIHFAGGSGLPLNEFESTRYGATLSLISHW